MRARPELGLDGEPELVFQPAVDLATGRLLGFEAFLRWNDPELGPIPPSVLIPWAESNGHMVELNAWVLSEACAAAASWQADLQLAVNCSVFQLRQREAASAAAAAIEESGINPDRLTIEITETSVTDEGAAADLHAMSRLGIQLTVDDIGSDWSTIESLQQFSINTMKIDGSLIEGLADEGGVNRAMVETIVHVSHSLGICCVAESVETAQQVKILRELGADVGQGYFFAKPLAVEDALMLTTMDPLPVFPLTDLSVEGDPERDDRYTQDEPGRDRDDADESTSDGPSVAAEVMGALDQADEAPTEESHEFVLNDDMHIEAADLSLVSKRGRLLGTFRKGKAS
jgi:EAL domain-containing protein (putative c-di-GMP-specific phosphodiesterase class I)